MKFADLIRKGIGEENIETLLNNRLYISTVDAIAMNLFSLSLTLQKLSHRFE